MAVSASTVRLHTKMPPNAETGSQESAVRHASTKVGLMASPQVLVCFKMAKAGSALRNSRMICTAASISTRLLYEIALPAILSNNSSKSPKKTPFW